MEFAAQGSVNVCYWFGNETADPLIADRLCVFAQTGGDGSMGAFWMDDDGAQKIVHMGSGSGSLLTCVLADDAVDFLRLIAIGYDEICWGGFSAPPDFSMCADGMKLVPHVEFQQWVTETFDVTIPPDGSAIVRHESEMGDESSLDPFCQWVCAITK